MPNRIIREGILDSREVSALSDYAQLLYRCMMSIVDDYGRYEFDADKIRAKCFPLQLDRWPSSRIGELLIEIGLSPLVTVYNGGSRKYFQINNFGQRVQAKSKFPPPPTVDHGDPPPRASRAHSESESESYAKSETESLAEVPPVRTVQIILTECWERHKSYRNGESMDHAMRIILSFVVPFDWNRLRDRHPAYCEYWARKGWNSFGVLTFIGWIQAGCPLPPEDGKRNKQDEIDKSWEEV